MKKIFLILSAYLFLYSNFSYAEKQYIKMKKKEKKDFAHFVLKAQLDNKMVFTKRNVPNRKGLYKFFDKFEDNMGVSEKGIEFNLSYSDIGDKNDWVRWGKPGFAQRFQIMEPYKETTKKGKTKWYRIAYFISNEIIIQESLDIVIWSLKSKENRVFELHDPENLLSFCDISNLL